MGFPRFYTEVNDETKHSEKTGTESNTDGRKLPAMRGKDKATGEASRRLRKAARCRDTLPSVPRESGSRNWIATKEAAEGMQDMPDNVLAESQQKSHDLLGELLELLGKTECRETMEGSFTKEELLELRDRIHAAKIEGSDVLGILRKQACMEETQSNPWADGEWPNQPRVEPGVPSRVNRLKGLGNAVVPQVAQFIGRCLVDAASGPLFIDTTSNLKDQEC